MTSQHMTPEFEAALRPLRNQLYAASSLTDPERWGNVANELMTEFLKLVCRDDAPVQFATLPAEILAPFRMSWPEVRLIPSDEERFLLAHLFDDVLLTIGSTTPEGLFILLSPVVGVGVIARMFPNDDVELRPLRVAFAPTSTSP